MLFTVGSSNIEVDGTILPGHNSVNEINDATLSDCDLPCLEG